MYKIEIIYPGPTPTQLQENDYNNKYATQHRRINAAIYARLESIGCEHNGQDFDSNGIVTYHFLIDKNKEEEIRKILIDIFEKHNIPVADLGKNNPYFANILFTKTKENP
jgi:hypothetical protein